MATTQDVGLLTRKLAAADYDPSRYVSEISQRCVGGEEVLYSWQNLVCKEGSKSEMGQGEKHSWSTISSLILNSRLQTALCIKRTELDPPWLAHKKANSWFL